MFESSVVENMKIDTTFVHMRSGDHLGNAKMSKKAPRSVEFNLFTSCDGQKRFLQNERRWACNDRGLGPGLEAGPRLDKRGSPRGLLQSVS